MTHIGVIKALFDAGSLPRIVCGSSAGSIVCAVLCTKRDNEIEKVLQSFCNGDLKVFVGDDEQEGLAGRIGHLWKRGHMFNAENLRRVMKYHLGDLTFKEGYFKTGKILNITVSSANTNESIRLLNYATTGDVLIWSAVVASCALPFGYEPGPLMRKDRAGNIERWDENTLHVDGSIDGDLPFDKVSAIFNVNHFVVSQVNPHVTPFLEDQEQSGDEHTFWNSVLSTCKDEIEDWLHPELLPLFATLRRKAAFIVGTYTTCMSLFHTQDTCSTIVENNLHLSYEPKFETSMKDCISLLTILHLVCRSEIHRRHYNPAQRLQELVLERSVESYDPVHARSE